MAWIDDIDVLNNAATAGDWSIVSGFDSPTLNDSAATTPIYLEGSACMWWPLKKGVTNGYVGTATISGTPTLTNRICVGFIAYPFADIANIPISAMAMRLSSATGFTTNYIQWDARAQILSPENVPISGHTPIIGYEDAGTETGTFSGNAEAIGWVATTGGTADGKQGGFDWFFLISWVGAHSVTLTGTYFSGLYDEYFDNEGSNLPGQTSRPIAVLSQAGDFFQSNVRFQMGDGTSDTANIVVTETGKTIFFNNLHVNHELGYLFVNPASTHEIRLTLTDCVHLWNDQASTSEIFDGIANVDHFQLDGCSFSRGGQVSLPADTANRWVRACKFDDCQAGTISDGEFTDCIVSNGEAFTVSGDADLTGTQFLTPVVAADASALVWTGNFDPDGNLDGCVFSKGTNAHHAIEFGISTPLTMTLRNIPFSGFNATDAQNDSTLYVRRTSGTVTINLIGCSGNISYKSSGATVVLVISPVSTTVKILDGRDNSNLQNSRVILKASDGTGDLPYYEAVSITRVTTTATVVHGAHGLATGNKVEIKGANQPEYNGVKTITVTTASAYTFTVSGSPATPATPHRLINNQNQSSYDNSPTTEGVFNGGTGHAALDVLTLDKNVQIAVVTVSAGVVATFVVLAGDSIGGISASDTLTQISTTGSGTGFTLTPDTDNLSVISTGLVLEGLTDVNGEISDTRSWSLAQPVTGVARKGTASPIFKAGNLTGTISTTAGLSITQALVFDE